MSASVGENTLITINFMSDCFVLFDDLDIAAKVRSFQNQKWDARASAWSSLWVQTRGTTVGPGRQKEPGLAQREIWLKTTESFTRSSRTWASLQGKSYRAPKIPLVAISTGPGLSASSKTAFFCPQGWIKTLGMAPGWSRKDTWTLGWEPSSIAPVIPGQGCMGSVPVQLFLALSRAKSRKSKYFRFSFLPSFAFYQNKQLHSQRENSSSPQRVVWSLIFYSL